MIITIICVLYPISVAQEASAPIVTLIEPVESPVINARPNITIAYTDPDGINLQSIQLEIDGKLDVTEWDETEISETEITYKPSEIFQFADGNHTVNLTISDMNGNTITQSWTLMVDTTYADQQQAAFNLFQIILYIIIGTIIAFLAIIIYIIYLKITKKFTFEKFFARHPIKKEVFIIYIPLIIAFIFSILSLAVVTTLKDVPLFSAEYVIVIGLFIGIGPYAIDAQLVRRKIIKYEQAFAQLLFEIADAMRGGLDPTKAIIELAKTETSVLKDQLKIASDNIKLGRPFDHVMTTMAYPIKSDLVKRYASLIGETSKIGGEPAAVIHRAAKDMDDFIKVGQERRRQLFSQASTIYIAFGVMLVVLYQLISMFPSLGSMDMSLLNSGNLESIETTSINRMSLLTIKQRFLDLLIINSIGTGTIIGSFIDGHIKFGLIHSLILTTTSIVFFMVMIL